jgi:hypothetical protein
LRTHDNGKGYQVATLSVDYRNFKLLVARLVLGGFVGPCPPGQEACHENGDRSDNRLTNLRWDTPSNNNLDKHRHGTMPPRRTQCPRGHLYLPGNLVPSALAKGGLTCLACSRARAAIQYDKRLGRPHATLAEVGDEYYEKLIMKS